MYKQVTTLTILLLLGMVSLAQKELTVAKQAPQIQFQKAYPPGDTIPKTNLLFLILGYLVWAMCRWFN